MIEIIREETGYAIRVHGPLTIRIDNSVIRNALWAAMREPHRAEHAFWDQLSGGVAEATTAANQMIANPLVQHVLAMADGPLTPVQAASMACDVADAMLCDPRYARSLHTLHCAASGDGEAMQYIDSVREAAMARPENGSIGAHFRELSNLASLLDDRAELWTAMMNSREVPPNHVLVYE